MKTALAIAAQSFWVYLNDTDSHQSAVSIDHHDMRKYTVNICKWNTIYFRSFDIFKITKNTYRRPPLHSCVLIVLFGSNTQSCFRVSRQLNVTALPQSSIWLTRWMNHDRCGGRYGIILIWWTAILNRLSVVQWRWCYIKWLPNIKLYAYEVTNRTDGITKKRLRGNGVH